MWPFKYPYTNFHEINLDWILETVKSNTDRIAENELKIALIGGDDPLNSLHPVGSIFISTENTSPASMFGGEWEQIGGRFLLGADSTYAAGSTGGEAEHKLTTTEIAEHEHAGLHYASPTGGPISLYTPDGSYPEAFSLTYTQRANGDAPTKIYTAKAGGSAPHNNMPPYLTVYMWKRVK